MTLHPLRLVEAATRALIGVWMRSLDPFMMSQEEMDEELRRWAEDCRRSS